MKSGVWCGVMGGRAHNLKLVKIHLSL